MSDIVTEVVKNQRSRAIATILGCLESEVYGYLTPEEQRRVRGAVMNAIAVYSDFVIDVIRAANKGVMFNEDAMRVLDEINQNTQALTRERG